MTNAFYTYLFGWKPRTGHLRKHLKFLLKPSSRSQDGVRPNSQLFMTSKSSSKTNCQFAYCTPYYLPLQLHTCTWWFLLFFTLLSLWCHLHLNTKNGGGVNGARHRDEEEVMSHTACITGITLLELNVLHFFLLCPFVFFLSVK